MLIVNTEIQQIGTAAFMGWAHEYKALVVQGTTVDEVKRELLISLRAKVAFDTKLPISNVQGREITEEELLKAFKAVSESESKFTTQLV